MFISSSAQSPARCHSGPLSDITRSRGTRGSATEARLQGDQGVRTNPEYHTKSMASTGCVTLGVGCVEGHAAAG